MSGYEQAVSTNVSMFTSGGGFSNFTLRASEAAYQNVAVNDYLTKHTSSVPPHSYFNTSGRGFPDVAALGNGYLVNLNGEFQGIGGISFFLKLS